ncbi:MAG: TRAP transporter large permease [Bacillota bacterium]|nr:TRAP transporter large permease [Bacillota bacterium]
MTTVWIALAVLVFVLIIGVPIPLAFFASSLTVVILGGYDYLFLLPYGYNKASSIILCAIPLFVLAGGFMEKGGIGESLVDWVGCFVGRIRGGLGIIMSVACALFGAISGSGMATLSCIGSIMLPRMYAAGYPKGHCAALISSASVLALLIPPSLDMILYAFVGGQSILACFMATAIPGIILTALFSIVNCFLLRNCETIQLQPKIPRSERPREEQFLPRTIRAIPALLCPLIILGGIYGGIMTPTEAAAVAVVYSIPVGIFIYKGLNRKSMKKCLVEAGTTAGVIMIMLFSVMILSRLYVMENVPQKLLEMMTSITDNTILLFLMINVFLVVIGMLMDDTSAILLCTPILLPVVQALGMDGVHFAAVVGVNLGLGCVTPPTAPFLYLGARIAGAPVNEMLRPTMYLIFFAWLPTLILVTYIPALSLWLPGIMGLV